MARRVGPIKVRQYSQEFKRTAVELSRRPGIAVLLQTVVDLRHQLCRYVRYYNHSVALGTRLSIAR